MSQSEVRPENSSADLGHIEYTASQLEALRCFTLVSIFFLLASLARFFVVRCRKRETSSALFRPGRFREIEDQSSQEKHQNHRWIDEVSRIKGKFPYITEHITQHANTFVILLVTEVL